MILGTRGSALALAQTNLVGAALCAAHADLEVSHQVVVTTGDLRQSQRPGPPDPDSDKSIWTRELEAALADGRIDAAVHSAKDVPTELPAGFQLVACLPRAAVEDVLVSKYPGGLKALPEGATVATSSVRRARQLHLHRPDLRVVAIRGNVPTRLRKLEADPSLDGLVLARAGLDRLGYLTPWYCLPGNQSESNPNLCPSSRATDLLPNPQGPSLPTGLHATLLSADSFLPAAGQGIVVLETLGEDARRDLMLSAITHQPTWIALRAEREFLRLLNAGCHTPIGLLSTTAGDHLHMQAIVFPEDQASRDSPHTARASGPISSPETVAAHLFQNLR
jgi:hydroxymethylbilane synthase